MVLLCRIGPARQLCEAHLADRQRQHLDLARHRPLVLELVDTVDGEADLLTHPPLPAVVEKGQALQGLTLLVRTVVRLLATSVPLTQGSLARHVMVLQQLTAAVTHPTVE